MADQSTIIAATLKVDAGSSSANIKEVKKDLADVSAAAKDTGTTATTHFAKLKEQMAAMPGATGQASEGVGKLGGAFKLLLANPVVLVITAIVGALTLLYKAFTSTDEGAQKVQAVFDGIGAVVRELADRILSFASAITKFFSGDFAGAAADGSKAISGFGDAMVNAFTRGKEASDLLDEVADSMRVLDLQYAAMSARLAKSKELLTDENASYRDKVKALKESGEEIDKYYKNKAENDEKEISAIAKKYNIEKQVDELRKQGYEKGAKEFDDYLQTLAIKSEGIEEIEGAIKKSIASGDEYSAKQRQQNRAENTLDREQATKNAEEKKKRDEAAKTARENLVAFNKQLTALQQANELAIITDSYAKETKALQDKLANDKAVNAAAFQDKKITKDQQNKLDEALDIQYGLQSTTLQDKHNKEMSDKEAKFQQEVADLTNKIRLDGITDGREHERVALEIEHQNALKKAIADYKDDQASFQIQKALIDQDFKNKQDAIDAKNKSDDAKKEFELQSEKLKIIIDANDSDFAAKKKAVDDEQALTQKAFDDKAISEEEYTKRMASYAEDRKRIKDDEQEHDQDIASAVSTTLGNLSTLVGKNTKLGKDFAVAQTTIDTLQSAIAAYKSMAGIPFVGPALGAVAAAAALKNGFDAIKKITAVDIPGEGSGGSTFPSLSTGSAGIISPAAPLAPTQSSTAVNQAGIDNAGDKTNPANRQPVRAYVLSGDVQDTADRDARLERASRLGG